MTPARDDLPRYSRNGRTLSAYRTREIAYPTPRPLRMRDNWMRVMNENATAKARPSQPANDPRTGLPDRKPRAALREPDLVPGPGEGVLSILVEGGDTAPVVGVDGVPVSVGNGQLDLVLRAGPHTVEVQNLSTVDPVVVHVAESGRHRLQFFENWVVGHRVLGDLPETFAFVSTNAGCWSWLVATSLICGLPVGGILSLMPTETWHLVSGIVIGVLAVAFIVFCWPLYRRAKAKYQRDVAAQHRTIVREPVPYNPDAILLGANPTAVTPMPVGAAAIDLHLECGRHLWAGHRKMATGSFLSRAWTRPPRVRINGVEQPAAWGHWRYHVPPGAHQITVTVDGRPLNLDIPDRHTGPSEKHRELTVEAHAGQAVSVNAEAHVYAAWRPATGDIETFEPRLWLETA